MNKILFNNKKNIKLNSEIKNNFSTGFTSDKDIFKKRTENYFKNISRLDNDKLSETKEIEKLIEDIKKEFIVPTIDSFPIGIISKCFLGNPYEVHTLSFEGSIIRHYKKGEKMEALFENARALAIHNEYATVEIYRDKIILVREDGTVIKV